MLLTDDGVKSLTTSVVCGGPKTMSGGLPYVSPKVEETGKCLTPVSVEVVVTPGGLFTSP